MEERTLIEQAGRGDEDAFRLLVERHQWEVYQEILRQSADPDGAFEVTCQTFLRAWHAIGLFQFDMELSTWLRQIAEDTSQTYFRQNHRKYTKTTEQKEPDLKLLTEAVMRHIRSERTRYSPKAMLGRMRFTLIALVIAALLLLASRFGLPVRLSASEHSRAAVSERPAPPQISAELHIVPAD